MRADGGRAGYCRQPVGIRHEIPLGLVVQVKALACESPSSRGVPLARWSQGRTRALRAGIRPGRHHQWQPDPAVALEGRKEIALKPIHRQTIYRSSRAVAALLVLALTWTPAGAGGRRKSRRRESRRSAARSA